MGQAAGEELGQLDVQLRRPREGRPLRDAGLGGGGDVGVGVAEDEGREVVEEVDALLAFDVAHAAAAAAGQEDG